MGKFLAGLYRRLIPKKFRNKISSLVMKLSGSDKKIQLLETHVDQMSLAISALESNVATNTQHASTLLNLRENRLHEFVKSALALAATNLDEARLVNRKLSNCELGIAFDSFGSDKNARHSYAEIYEELLSGRESPRILEIGLGSLNAFPYAGGQKPGSSLKAWRRRYPASFLVGADIDPESVNAVSEIAFVVDQTEPTSLDELSNKLMAYGQFDLIIDDGFHDPHANVLTLIKLIPHLAEDGAYVIEDVHSSLIDFWRVVLVAMGMNGEVLDMSPLRPETDDNVLVVVKSA
jgi:hypothetical protein